VGASRAKGALAGSGAIPSGAGGVASKGRGTTPPWPAPASAYNLQVYLHRPLAGGSFVFATCNAVLRTPLCFCEPCFHSAIVRTAPVNLRLLSSPFLVLSLVLLRNGFLDSEPAPSPFVPAQCERCTRGAGLRHTTPLCNFNSLIALWSCSSLALADAWEPTTAALGASSQRPRHPSSSSA